MNAHALLTSQGWRGTGHSLHHSSDTVGLSRPLLVSKKDNVLGVGKKQHKTSDMWWMNAFDASLKGLDTSKEGQVKVQEGGGLEMVVRGGSKWVGGKGGLYSFFVRGGTVGGTMEEDEEKEVVDIIVKGEKREKGKGKGKDKDKKRKGEERKESKEERRARKEKKRADRAGKSAAKEAEKTQSDKEAKAQGDKSADSEKMETKEERRARKERERQKKLLRQSKKESSTPSSTPEVAKGKKKKSRKDK